jgi:hypothetical protein
MANGQMGAQDIDGTCSQPFYPSFARPDAANCQDERTKTWIKQTSRAPLHVRVNMYLTVMYV